MEITTRSLKFIKELSMLTCIIFFTSSETLIIIIFALYKAIPLVEKATIIARGIKKIKVLSFSIKIFSMAGSNNHAVAEVLPATKIENTPARIILKTNFFM